jgi:hypothetical protein
MFWGMLMLGEKEQDDIRVVDLGKKVIEEE